MWVVATLGLIAYLSASTAFGDTYGPLAGFIGVMLWAQFTSVALLAGLAVSAQLEAHRAGVPDPISRLKESF